MKNNIINFVLGTMSGLIFFLGILAIVGLILKTCPYSLIILVSMCFGYFSYKERLFK